MIKMRALIKQSIIIISILSWVICSSVLVNSSSKIILQQPQKAIRTPAEWETVDYVILRWPYDYWGLDELYLSLTREIVEVCKVVIVVDSEDTKNYVINYLNSNGVSTANVTFFIVETNSIWVRDYGPISIIDTKNGQLEFVDMKYDRYGRIEDDNFPWRFAKSNGIVWYNMTDGTRWLRLEGGNFMVDGAGIFYTTNRIFEQNLPDNGGDLYPSEVVEWMKNYYNLWEFRNVTKMTADGTGHIDMQIKLLNETTVIISKIDDITDEDFKILEYNRMFFENLTARNGMKYNIYRIPLVKYGSTYYTYTNSLIVNKKVLVPIYGLSTDSQALSVYQQAMPEYKIVGINARSIIHMKGAIHCISMQVSKCNRPPEINIEDIIAVPNQNVSIRARVIDDNIRSVSLFYNSSLNKTIIKISMKEVSHGIYEATLPPFPSNTRVNFFIEVEDRDLAINYSGDAKNPHIIDIESIDELPSFMLLLVICVAHIIIFLSDNFIY